MVGPQETYPKTQPNRPSPPQCRLGIKTTSRSVLMSREWISTGSNSVDSLKVVWIHIDPKRFVDMLNALWRLRRQPLLSERKDALLRRDRRNRFLHSAPRQTNLEIYLSTFISWKGRDSWVDAPRIQSPIGTSPALSAGLPSMTSRTCQTFSVAVSGSHIRMLRPRRDGWALFSSRCCCDHVREGTTGTTDTRSAFNMGRTSQDLTKRTSRPPILAAPH